MSSEHHASRRFVLRIRGHVGEAALRSFPDMEVQVEGADTILTGYLPDPAAVYGVVAQIERLGLELIEISRPQLDSSGGAQTGSQSPYGGPEPVDGRESW